LERSNATKEDVMHMKKVLRLAAVFILCICGSFPATIQAAQFKVLVLMSYEETNPWCIEIKEGIDSALTNTCEVTYFYMDTKINLKGGEQKAKMAYSLFKNFQPDGVIAVDDNAQSMFVLPYLKNKVKTPVMFCGLNAEPEKYGYPASNVSGILERAHINESIALAKQLVPTIKTVGFLAKNSPSGKAILRQVERESEKYLAKFIDFKLSNTIKETLVMVEELKKQSDLLFVEAINGILDDNGKPLSNKQVTRIVSEAFRKPMIGANKFQVEFGVLCAVVKTGQEQGRTAAKMLLKAMQGTPVSEMPITRNYNGSRIINVTVMKELDIKPKPIVLLGAQLVRTEK
jgi:ABC-type uncharacterized transport system substrate-binding protein